MQFFNEQIHDDTVETTVFLSEGLVIVAKHQNGRLVGAVGATAKVKQIEMDCVEVERNGKVAFLELGEDVKWLEPELN